MATEPTPLTTEQRFAALAPALDWYIPRLLDPGITGQLCRRAAVDVMRGQQQTDTDRGIDMVARRLLAETLKRYDASPQNQPATEGNVTRLLRALNPVEVAFVIDGSVPPVVLERLGKASDALGDCEAEHFAGQVPEAFDALDDVTKAAMPFAEAGRRSTQPLRAKHLAPADADQVAAESLRRIGFVIAIQRSCPPSSRGI